MQLLMLLKDMETTFASWLCFEPPYSWSPPALSLPLCLTLPPRSTRQSRSELLYKRWLKKTGVRNTSCSEECVVMLCPKPNITTIKVNQKDPSLPTETPMRRVMPPATNRSRVCTHVSQRAARIALFGVQTHTIQLTSFCLQRAHPPPSACPVTWYISFGE